MNPINITLVSLPLATNLETITATCYNATRHTEVTHIFSHKTSGNEFAYCYSLYTVYN